MQTLLTICYDGTEYSGWQRQQNAATVQQKMEEALAAALPKLTLAGDGFALRAASRTDAGVHALGQRAVFRHNGIKIPLEKLPGVINAYLPGDISVTAAEDVPDGFNPRHAQRKTYRYQIHNAKFPNPLLNRYSAFVPQELNISAMEKAAPLFMGRHDFKSFCAVGGTGSGEFDSTVREIYDCRFTVGSERTLTLTVTGGAFLYNMVRIIAGTILYAGLGKILPEEIPEIIRAKDRRLAGKTMPPEGLTLMEVLYDVVKDDAKRDT